VRPLRLCVSTRTIYHDIIYLKDALDGYCYAAPTLALPTIITTAGDLLPLFLGKQGACDGICHGVLL
jgi:hypothetical protein